MGNGDWGLEIRDWGLENGGGALGAAFLLVIGGECFSRDWYL